MTVKEAYRILGLLPGTGLQDIKRKYRELMMHVHPDVNAHAKQQSPHPANADHPHGSRKYTYTAQEINTAYSILKKEISTDIQTEIRHKKDCPKKEKQSVTWNAPMNQNAFMEREVLQYVEDYDGTVLGNFCIASGKYMWTTDEDFSLFLLSIYQCSKQLLDEADSLLSREEPPASRHRFQAELTYLLAQQFIAQTALLEQLAKEEKTDPKGNRIFYIPAMLEISGRAISLKTEEPLYPSQTRRHRLYLQNRAGQEAGYLSFPDDRLYYIVIPLFEHKAVQIKVQVAKKQPDKKKKAATAYQNLHLWIKLSDKNCGKLPENLNLQIERLLKQYTRPDQTPGSCHSDRIS